MIGKACSIVLPIVVLCNIMDLADQVRRHSLGQEVCKVDTATAHRVQTILGGPLGRDGHEAGRRRLRSAHAHFRNNAG